MERPKYRVNAYLGVLWSRPAAKKVGFSSEDTGFFNHGACPEIDARSFRRMSFRYIRVIGCASVFTGNENIRKALKS
jgi:hypothetical protein